MCVSQKSRQASHGASHGRVTLQSAAHSVTRPRPSVTRLPSGVTRCGPDLLACLGLLLAALILHRDGLFGGPAFYERDTQLFYYPLANWVSEQLHAGVYPRWLPGIFTGYPIYADGELGLLYLPQVALLALLPAAQALVWLRVGHAFAAGAWMLLLLRTLRLGTLAGLGGGLVFAFGSFVTAQMHHENVVRSAVWLPLVLTGAERALRSPTRRSAAWLAVGALAFAQSATGLHVQPVLMLALALAAYVAYRLVFSAHPAGESKVWATRLPAPGRTSFRRHLTGSLWMIWVRRLMAPGWTRSRPGLFVLVAGGIGLGGFTIAAAQWLPLVEWALVSFRRGGVDYTFASAFELAPQNLPTLVFPYFFRLPDGATWWTLWQQWETELYVGIPTLALILVGIVGSHRREVFFFAPLGVAALLVGMAATAPVVNLHLMLWSVPGFSFLRAPGRFTYLVVFAGAGLAALGLEVLSDAERRSRWSRRPRLLLALVGAAPAVGALAALLALFPTWRAALLADPSRARTTIEAMYLAARAQYPIDPALVYRGLLASLDLANPKTAWSLALLALTAVLFVVWLGLGTRRAWLGQACFVALLAVDLLVFAVDFHPRAPLASLRPAPLPGVAPGERVLLDGPESLPDLEPDQLLADDVSTVGGYSSLPSQRHVELLDQTQDQPALLDLWSERFVVEPTRPTDGHTAGGVSFRAEHPLAASFGNGLAATFEVPADFGPVSAIRLVGTLSYAFDVPQGTPVAELRVLSADAADTTDQTETMGLPIRGGTQPALVTDPNQTASLKPLVRAGVEPATATESEQTATLELPIRAGIELAERAFDRPSLRGALAHRRPPGPTALDFEEVTPEGEAYVAHLYLAELPLPRAMRLARLTLTASLPRVLVQVHGIGVVSPSGAVRSLDLADRRGFRLAAQDDRARVVEDLASLPRAFVVPQANSVSPARHPNLTPVQIVVSPDFDPRRDVLIEGDPAAGSEPNDAAAPPAAAEVVDLGPEAIEVHASLDRPGYLVLNDFYHRGWTARVDGQSTRVFIANAVFRAVALAPGQHVVEFRFEPLSHLVGAIVSALALVVVVAVAAWGFLARSGSRAPPSA
jgi:hypothetical protein